MTKYIVNANHRKSRIHPEIYGHFSEHLGRCIYNGIYVGEDSPVPNTHGIRNDVAEALRAIRIPVLRWPGGCFADEYHWKDGVGPKENRKKMINTHWGGVVEDNSFGTHEFMELCRQLDCEPYINGNVGSGSVREMSDWMEYMTFDGVSPMADLRRKNGQDKAWRIKYFGVGNENWGCGGNMRPEYYADRYRRYQTYVRNYGDNHVFRIACGPNADDYHWTDTVMKIAGKYMDGLSLHYYTIPSGNWQHKGSSTDFNTEEYYATLEAALQMKELISRHSGIMDRYDPEKRVGLVVDEWGGWYDVEPGTNPGFLYQQNTMRDAMIAAVTLNIFNKNSDRVVMANLAQMVNVLQAVLLTEGEKMLRTPTYYVFDLYKNHQNAELLESCLETQQDGGIPQLHESASVEEDGQVHITVANLSGKQDAAISCELPGKKAEQIRGRILHSGITSHNTFEAPETVHPETFTDYTVKGTREEQEKSVLEFHMPPCSIVELTVK